MPLKKHKVLIIKVGYSETLDPEISTITSYGDVLRTTVLLNLYKEDHVTWLVDEKAYPILKNNPLIDRILGYNLTSVLQLQSEHFDTVINLEKVPGICALADQITAWRRYGFRFDIKKGEAEAYDGTQNALFLCQNEEEKKNHNKYWQEHLFEMVGATWDKHEYVMGHIPATNEEYDIGFNYQVGNKWPLKAWSTTQWKELEALIGKKYKISWQQGLNNMEDYFDWIHSCRLVVTNDTFGMHLAIAMKKKMICMFGPTHHSEHYLYGLGKSLYPENLDCEEFPCRVDKCPHYEESCMSMITPDEVYVEIKKIMETRSVEH